MRKSGGLANKHTYPEGFPSLKGQGSGKAPLKKTMKFTISGANQTPKKTRG